MALAEVGKENCVLCSRELVWQPPLKTREARINEHLSNYHNIQSGTSFFLLSRDKGKQVQEILNRYVNEELIPKKEFCVDPEHIESIDKDIYYIRDLAKLFD